MMDIDSELIKALKEKKEYENRIENSTDELVISCAKMNLNALKIRIYLLRRYPIVFKNYEYEKVVFSNNPYPYYILYNNAIFYSTRGPEPPYVAYDKGNLESAETIADFLSFIFHSPSFIFSSDQTLNERLINLYTHFNLFDLGIVSNFYNEYEFLHIDIIDHPMILSLYNSAMKQPDPLARCVFLFRVFEYYHQNISTGMNTEDCLDYLYHNMKKHRFLPLDKVSMFDEDKKVNLISNWKAITRRKLDNLNSEGISLCDFLYKFARCGVAHGRYKNSIILHDLDTNYKLIQKAVIFLELIARYIIEIENPSFKDHVKIRNRRHEFLHKKNPTIVYLP